MLFLALGEFQLYSNIILKIRFTSARIMASEWQLLNIWCNSFANMNLKTKTICDSCFKWAHHVTPTYHITPIHQGQMKNAQWSPLKQVKAINCTMHVSTSNELGSNINAHPSWILMHVAVGPFWTYLGFNSKASHSSSITSPSKPLSSKTPINYSTSRWLCPRSILWRIA